MRRLCTLLFISIFTISCGVNTSSSFSSDSSNPMHQPDINSTDGNNTPDSNSTDITACSDDSIFECSNAIYDADACSALNYKIASDASYNGMDPAENGSDFFNIENEGLSIRSEHLEGSSADSAKTWVTLYYKSFPSPKDLGIQGYTSYLKPGYFQLSYDIAWSDTSIPNIDRTMYVRTNQGLKPACYRLNLNNIDGKLIDVQKVYR